ncbi:hypothetical protein EDB83DRAFT_2658736 [Lactarius deliciosus]|nr:hypothetical protein EDB83DRAFT_2658736 [Lactarius deliciosus]
MAVQHDLSLPPLQLLGIARGNPGVFQGYPYPYPNIPIPATGCFPGLAWLKDLGHGPAFGGPRPHNVKPEPLPTAHEGLGLRRPESAQLRLATASKAWLRHKLVMGKFGSVRVFALFFSASSWTEGLFRGSFCSEVWLDQNIPQTESIVQFGVWQKGTQIQNSLNFPITITSHGVDLGVDRYNVVDVVAIVLLVLSLRPSSSSCQRCLVIGGGDLLPPALVVGVGVVGVVDVVTIVLLASSLRPSSSLCWRCLVIGGGGPLPPARRVWVVSQRRCGMVVKEDLRVAKDEGGSHRLMWQGGGSDDTALQERETI